MSLYDKILSHPALLADFQKAATPEKLSSDLIAWLRARPEMAGFPIPGCLRAVRTRLGCPARRGGLRKRGAIFYSVAGRGKECA